MTPKARTPAREVWMDVIDGGKLRRARMRRGLSQAELARLVQRSQQYISLLEMGRDRDCSELTAIRICRYLAIDVEDYFRARTATPLPPVTTLNSPSGRRIP